LNEEEKGKNPSKIEKCKAKVLPKNDSSPIRKKSQAIVQYIEKQFL